MSENRLLASGIAGTVVAALCCFTPLLVIALAGVGLTGVVAWLDYALFPVLFFSLGLTAYALYLRANRPGVSPAPVVAVGVAGLSALLIWFEFKYALRISVAAVALVGLYALYLRRITPQHPCRDRETSQ